MTYASEVLADSPYLWWRLGESSGATAADASGNARTGTYGGTPTYSVTGLVDDSDTAVSANATTQFVQRLSVGLTSIASFSIEFWFKTLPPASANNNVVEVTGSSTQFRLLADTNGTCSARGGSTSGGWTGIPNILDNARHHIVFATTGSSARLYIDGVQFGTAQSAPATLNISTIKFGSSITGGTAFPTIVLDEFSAYTTALSAARVSAHYTAATTPPITIHPNKITSTGTVHAPAIAPYIPPPADGNITITAELTPATKHAACIEPDRSAQIEPARHVAGVNAT